MTRTRPADEGRADVTTPLGRVRLQGRVPPVWFFIIAAVGLFGTIGFAIDRAPVPGWVLAAPAPAYLLLFYLIRCFAGLVRTHGDVLAGDAPARRRLPPPAG